MAITQMSRASPRTSFVAYGQCKGHFHELTLSMTIQNRPLPGVKQSLRPLIMQQGINTISAMPARGAVAASNHEYNQVMDEVTAGDWVCCQPGIAISSSPL